jgi:hypothetical protein
MMMLTCGCETGSGLPKYCDAHNPCFSTSQRNAAMTHPETPALLTMTAEQWDEYEPCVFKREAEAQAAEVARLTAVIAEHRKFAQQRETLEQCSGLGCVASSGLYYVAVYFLTLKEAQDAHSKLSLALLDARSTPSSPTP